MDKYININIYIYSIFIVCGCDNGLVLKLWASNFSSIKPTQRIRHILETEGSTL